jgi:hypothetical protein
MVCQKDINAHPNLIFLFKFSFYCLGVMSQQEIRLTKYFGKLSLEDTLVFTGTDGITLPSSTVTQATSVTTAVTINAVSGIITTFSQSAAAEVTVAFTVNNSDVAATDKVIACITNYAGTFGTNGIPVISVGTVADGSFVVRVSNTHSANALSGAIKISFVVLK